MMVDVYAPYGRFRQKAEAADLWIAGGVGVTPFIAWLQAGPADRLQQVTLIYLHTPGRELPATVDLNALAAERGVNLVDISGGPESPAFRACFATIVRARGAVAVRIAFCGPDALLHKVHALMEAHGVPFAHLRNELFEFR